MIKFVIKRNAQHGGTGEIISTYETVSLDIPALEAVLKKKWEGMCDCSVVEVKVLPDGESTFRNGHIPHF